jgi:hypothetical protein
MGNRCITQRYPHVAAEKAAVSSDDPGSSHHLPPLPRAGNLKDAKRFASRRSFVESVAIRDGTGAANANVNALGLQLDGNLQVVELRDALESAAVLLGTRAHESDLTKTEVVAALKVYKELQRVLTMATRTGDWMSRPADYKFDDQSETTFHARFEALMEEFDQADDTMTKAVSAPAAVRPLNLPALQEVTDFFILDNSLRETTVGASLGHTMAEKQKVIHSLAGTGLEEIILGSYGNKISVDSQIPQYWQALGKSFDSTWGFSEAYDCEAYDEKPIWESINEFTAAEEKGETVPFYTPPANPNHSYSKEETALFLRASADFNPGAFEGKDLEQVLKEAEKDGLIPLGLLMLAGYGICNAIIEIDTSLESFDYSKYDIVERCKYLINWCKKNLPRRQNVPAGEDNTARVLINLRDFTNFNRSKSGTEEALRLVDALSRLPSEERPFGFMTEEPSGSLFPDEIGRIVRMVRLTMERAGFPQGRFLVHLHWYFGLAEAATLTALCNGADGVWAAVCRTGAQTGHACSTMTAVNLFRAGHHDLAKKYNFEKMCAAAREVTAITTRQPCPPHEEIYGKSAFDVTFFMPYLPSCRYSIAMLLKYIGISERAQRLNELSSPMSIYYAMIGHFGPPDEFGWDPSFCAPMSSGIKNHLVTGLSRDYNTALGLGHLYALVSRQVLSSPMVTVMVKMSPITNYHPTVLEFIQRWNRLCAEYEGEVLPPHAAVRSKSIMMVCTSITVEPRRKCLPFQYFLADVMRNPAMEQTPRLFKLHELSLLTQDERRVQKTEVPVIDFYEAVMRLKLFIQESDSLGVLGLVDDFVIRKQNDFYFGEDHLWLQEVRETKSDEVSNLIRAHLDYYVKFYAVKGNNAMTRAVKAIAKRIKEKSGIKLEMAAISKRESMIVKVKAIADCTAVSKRGSMIFKVKAIADYDYTADLESEGSAKTSTTRMSAKAHETMIRHLLEDEGEDGAAAAAYLKENKTVLGVQSSIDDLVAAYVKDSLELAESRTVA